MRIALSVLVLAACCGSALAGLATDSAAWTDPNSGFQWHGSTVMAGTGDSAGFGATIEWAVFGPGDYPGSYTADANEFVYAYQVQVLPNSISNVTKLSVTMLDSNEANDIGDDATLITGDAPTTSSFFAPPPNLILAQWSFDSLLAGEVSDTLVYSSVNVPLMNYGSIIDSGKSAIGQVPAPADYIPEPASLSLLALGAAAVIRRRR